jgi:SLT domain-containing protein
MLKFIGAGGATGDVAKIITGIPTTLVKDALKFMAGKAESDAAAAAAKAGSGKLAKGTTSGSVASWLTQALNADHEPLSWLGDLEWLVNAESSGNPDAVDPIVVDGQNATGLLQTLPSTYSEYGGAPGGILNPVDNAEAAIRYIAARYGSPGNIPGILVHDSGYDAGGWLMPGLTLAHNNTGQPERVTPPGGGDDGGMMHATINVDGKSLFDAMVPYGYKKSSRNNGNANANRYFAPGNQ